MYPEELRYTAEHEWVRIEGDEVVVGITEYAQEALGDVVYVSLPGVGQQVAAGAVCGEVESTKSVSDVYSPLAGAVVAVNETLVDAPETINTDPYGAGWLFRLAADTAGAALLTADEYRALLPA